jgi:phage gp16-like protein
VYVRSTIKLPCTLLDNYIANLYTHIYKVITKDNLHGEPVMKAERRAITLDPNT